MFESGVCNMFDNIINDEFPIISMTFQKKTQLYVYYNNEWDVCNDKILNEFITKFIMGSLFREFTEWQKENKESLKSSSLSSKYHETLLYIMNTPKTTICSLRKYLITKIRSIN